MVVKTCKTHGPLVADQCYAHKHGTRGSRAARVDYECKQCVSASRQTQNAVKARRLGRRKRYLEDPVFREKKKASESERYRKDPAKFGKQTQEWRRALKKEVLAHYANGDVPKCVLCGEDDLRFLALDHAAGDGVEHRRKNPSIQGNPYRWAKKHGLPPIFRTLCHNCNVKEARRKAGPGTSGSSCDLRRLKTDVFSHYSAGKIECAACAQDDLDVLTLDHVDGGGNEHRRSLRAPTTWALYRWVRKNGFPAGFRVLCFNHNLGPRCLGD